MQIIKIYRKIIFNPLLFHIFANSNLWYYISAFIQWLDSWPLGKNNFEALNLIWSLSPQSFPYSAQFYARPTEDVIILLWFLLYSVSLSLSIILNFCKCWWTPPSNFFLLIYDQLYLTLVSLLTTAFWCSFNLIFWAQTFSARKLSQSIEKDESK